MGKSVTVAETLSAKGVRLDGCGQTHSQQVLGKIYSGAACIQLTYHNS